MSRRLRIAVVTSQFPVGADPQRGRPILQTVTGLASLAEVRVLVPAAGYPRVPWLRPRGYEAHEATAVPGLPVEAIWVTYGSLPLVGRAWNGLAAATAIGPELSSFGPDLVLAYWAYPDGAAAVRWARHHQVPVVVGARGSDLRVPDRLTAWLTRRALRHANHLLVVSDELGQVARRSFGMPADRVTVIRNGCDTRIFQVREQAAARAALGLAGGPLAVYVGRLVAEKGLRELVDAVRRVRAGGLALRLAMVGEGPLQAELRALCADLGPAVTFAGRQPPEVVSQWMTAGDLVALPSYSEGHPNVLVEALASGRPAVSCPVGGVPEVVDAQSGELVPPRDAVALAEGLRRALSRQWDPSALAARHGRSWSDVAADTLRVCADAVREGPLGARSR